MGLGFRVRVQLGIRRRLGCGRDYTWGNARVRAEVRTSKMLGAGVRG